MILRFQNDMNFRSGEAMSQGSRPRPLAALSPTPYNMNHVIVGGPHNALLGSFCFSVFVFLRKRRPALVKA